MTEQEFKEKAQAMFTGDKAAFSDLYQELKKPVYTVIYRVLYNRAEAEDVMQEVFLRLFRQPPTDPVQNPRAYIFMTARNMAISAKRKRQSEELDDNLPDQARSAEEALCDRSEIERALSVLSLPEREIVTLHLSAGFRFREIAGMTSTPLGTVLWRYQHAIGILRTALTK